MPVFELVIHNFPYVTHSIIIRDKVFSNDVQTTTSTSVGCLTPNAFLLTKLEEMVASS